MPSPLQARSATPELSDFYVVVAPLLAALVAAASPAVLNDPDTWWHVATGESILNHGAIPKQDVFSFSAPGIPWSAHEWLTEVLLQLAHRLAGWSGIVLLTGIAAGGALAVVAARASRALAGAPLLVVTLLSYSLIAPSLLARPHIFGLLFLAIWTSGLLAARDADRAPSPFLLPLMLLWTNMHASFLLGLALMGPFALEALIKAPAGNRFGVFKSWTLFGLAAVALALVNPQFYDAFLYPVRVMNLRLLSGIVEWRPASFDHVEAIEIVILALIGLGLFRPVRVPPVRLLLLLGLVHMALHQGRQQMVLAIVAPLLLAAPMGEAFPANATAAPIRRFVWRGALAVLALAAVLRAAFPLERMDSPTAPISALAAVPPELRKQPVLNALGFGGYLIFLHVRPYIDGRSDMYGDAFMDNYDRVVGNDGAALDQTLAQENIAWTIFPPDAPILKAMDARSGWRRLYSNSFAVIHARTDAAPSKNAVLPK